MKILHMHTQGGAIGYYRFWLPAKALQEAGHEVTYFKGELDFFHDVHRVTGDSPEKWLFDHGGEFDVAHVGYSNLQAHTTLMQALRNMVLQRFDKELPIITDIDDDPISVPSYNVSFKHYTAQANKKKDLMIQLRSSDLVTVTTPSLVDVLKSETKHLSVLPNYCNPKDWDHFPVNPDRGRDKAVYIMYAGGPAHLGDLAVLNDVAPLLTAKYDGKEGRPLLRWVFVGYAPPWAKDWLKDKRDPKENRAFFIQPCQIETFWRALRWVSPDIFIAPVEMNRFNESKSVIKAYDAVTANAAFVCQDWTTYGDVPEKAAFKVRGDTQWKETLEALIEDPALRAKKANSLREWVFDARRISDHIGEWVDVYSEALKRPVIKDISDIISPRIIRPSEIY